MARKLLTSSLFALLLAPLALPGAARASGFGTDITLFDNKVGASDNATRNTWWGGLEDARVAPDGVRVREDQEVEPGDQPGQQWDLEGFFLDGTKLTMVGGYDFDSGCDGVMSGDIFLDVDGDAQYGADIQGSGSGNAVVANTFGYDYALALDFTANTFAVWGLSGSSTLAVYYGVNSSSNPWRYNDGGTLLVSSLQLTYVDGLTDSEVAGLQGGDHHAVTVDLSFLGAGQDFTAHFTMECGNDNLMGRGTTPVPEPGTMALLGTGLLGLAGVVRRKWQG